MSSFFYFFFAFSAFIFNNLHLQKNAASRISLTPIESLKSLPIFGLEKGQKYSLFMGQAHNAFIISTTFI